MAADIRPLVTDGGECRRPSLFRLQRANPGNNRPISSFNRFALAGSAAFRSCPLIQDSSKPPAMIRSSGVMPPSR